MKRAFYHVTIALLLTYGGISYGQVTKSETATSKVEAATEAKKPIDPNRKLPFHGKVVAVNQVDKTIKISSRIFKVMSDTEITKANKPATLKDAVIGEVTGGSYKNNNGTLELVKLRLGPKVEESATTAPTRAVVVKADKPAVKK